MAIAGGTTVLQESAALDGAGFPRKTHLLIRNTGNPADLGLSDTEQVVSVVDFYEPAPYSAPRDPHQDTSTWHGEAGVQGLVRRQQLRRRLRAERDRRAHPRHDRAPGRGPLGLPAERSRA